MNDRLKIFQEKVQQFLPESIIQKLPGKKKTTNGHSISEVKTIKEDRTSIGKTDRQFGDTIGDTKTTGLASRLKSLTGVTVKRTTVLIPEEEEAEAPQKEIKPQSKMAASDKKVTQQFFEKIKELRTYFSSYFGHAPKEEISISGSLPKAQPQGVSVVTEKKTEAPGELSQKAPTPVQGKPPEEKAQSSDLATVEGIKNRIGVLEEHLRALELIENRLKGSELPPSTTKKLANYKEKLNNETVKIREELQSWNDQMRKKIGREATGEGKIKVYQEFIDGLKTIQSFIQTLPPKAELQVIQKQVNTYLEYSQTTLASFSEPKSEKKVSLEEIEQKLENLITSLKRLNTLEAKAQALGKSGNTLIEKSRRLSEHKLQNIYKEIENASNLQTGYRDASPEERIKIGYRLLDMCKSAASELKELKQTEGIFGMRQKFTILQGNIEVGLAAQEKATESRADSILDPKVSANLEVIHEFYRPSQAEKYKDSKLVFNPSTGEFFIKPKNQIEEGLIKDKKKVNKKIYEILEHVTGKIEGKVDPVSSTITGKVDAGNFLIGKGRGFTFNTLYENILAKAERENNRSFAKEIVSLMMREKFSFKLFTQRNLNVWLKNNATVDYFREHSGIKDEEEFVVDEGGHISAANQTGKEQKMQVVDLMGFKRNIPKEEKPQDSFFVTGAKAISEANLRIGDPINAYETFLNQEISVRLDELKKLQNAEQLTKEEEQRVMLLTKEINDRRLDKKNIPYSIPKNKLYGDDLKVANLRQNAAVVALREMFGLYCNRFYPITYHRSSQSGSGEEIEHTRWNLAAQERLADAGFKEFWDDKDEVLRLFEKNSLTQEDLPKLMQKLEEFKRKYPPADNPQLARIRADLGIPLPKFVKRNIDGSIQDNDSAKTEEWKKWAKTA